jgi:hypothetical protein
LAVVGAVAALCAVFPALERILTRESLR